LKYLSRYRSSFKAYFLKSSSLFNINRASISEVDIFEKSKISSNDLIFGADGGFSASLTGLVFSLRLIGDRDIDFFFTDPGA